MVTGVGNGRLCGLLVNICIYGFGIAFVITTAISLRFVQLGMSLSPKNLTMPIYIASIDFDSYLYLWMQSNPKFNFSTRQRKRNTKWICRCILYADVWNCPNCSLTDTKLTWHPLAVRCRCDYILWLLFHRNGTCHHANHWYASPSE